MAASFGVIVSSGRPYTLLNTPRASSSSGILHLTQVSLDDGPGDNTVTLRCLVGNKPPIIIARLLPRLSESLQLDLRYHLSEEPTFSVLGPRKLHLAGYFHALDVSADSESFGEDIAQTESEKSVDSDTYGGSFINDSDPGYSSSSSANSSFEEAKECPRNGKKCGRQRLVKVAHIVSSTDSLGESGGSGTKIKALVSDSDNDIEFYENSLLKRKLPSNGSAEGAGQKSVSTFQDLTRNFEIVNDSAEKSVVPDPEGLLVSSLTQQSTKWKESKKGSKDANPGRMQEKGAVEGELSTHINHEAGKESAPSRQITVEAMSESKANKKKHMKGDPSQNVVNVQIHEAGKPENEIPRSPHTAEETDLELKSKKKKKKKQVKGELGCNDEPTKDQVSGILIDMDQPLSVKCLEAGKADHYLQQPNELVKDASVKFKAKRKEHDVKGQTSLVVDKETETTGVIPATTAASLGKIEDESKKEKSDKCKKKRKRSESSKNSAGIVDTETRVWTSPNGVVVEELVQGHGGGKIALPGKRISVHYVGKIEGSDDFITSGDSPLKFRLGGHDAIEGWNEGLEGVRTGDKRRLTVLNRRNDPVGSRMVYEIEVLRVH